MFSSSPGWFFKIIDSMSTVGQVLFYLEDILTLWNKASLGESLELRSQMRVRDRRGLLCCTQKLGIFWNEKVSWCVIFYHEISMNIKLCIHPNSSVQMSLEWIWLFGGRPKRIKMPQCHVLRIQHLIALGLWVMVVRGLHCWN